MPHRIVLDARRIADFGIGTYIRNLVRSLSKIDHSNHYTLVTPVPEVPEFSDLPSNFETAFYEGKKTGFVQLGYTVFLRKLPADLFHVPLNAVPLWMPKPYLVTIHDMSTLIFANHHSGYRSKLRHFVKSRSESGHTSHCNFDDTDRLQVRHRVLVTIDQPDYLAMPRT